MVNEYDLSKKNYYICLDVLRVLLAMLVVAIHTGPLISIHPQLNSIFVNSICRISVPIFFIINGFFFFKTDPNLQKLKKYVINLFTTYLCWSILYCLITSFPYSDIQQILSYLTLMVTEGYGHLWYVYSLIIGICIVFVLNKSFNGRVLFIVGIVLYIIGAIINDIAPFLRQNILTSSSVRHTLFMAVPFISLGAALNVITINTNKLKILAILSVIVFFTETVIIELTGINSGHENNLYLIFASLLVWGGTICICCKKESHNFFNRIGVDGGFLRKLSGYIFFVHGIPIVLLKKFEINSCVYFGLVLGISIVLSLLIIDVKNRLKLKLSE